MITQEKIVQLIQQHSTQQYTYSDTREIEPCEITKVAEKIFDCLKRSEEEWEELVNLKTENAVLKAENEIYRAFLTSSNYKLPKTSRAKTDKDI